MTDLASRLREARQAAGVSLAAMAARTHYSKALLGHLETGKRSARREHVVAYSRALHSPLDALYGGVRDPLRIAHEWLVKDTPVIVQSSAGRRVGGQLASELEARLIELRLLDDAVGGCDLLPAVRKELHESQRLVNDASYDDPTGQRLLTVVGELSQLCGWVASDAGCYAEAQDLYISGVSAAQTAGNDSLAGQLLSSLSYQVANVGDPRDAALLARSAVRGAEDTSTPVVKTLLLERVAWACARSQDDVGAARTLDAVDNTYESRSSACEEPHWTYWMSRAEIDIMAGRCFVELGKPGAAAPLLARAIEQYAPERSREVALYRTWLAESYFRSGEIDAARTVLALARKSGRTVNSARLDRRIDQIEELATSA